jgi:16S rRNA processing protein RimM
LSTSSTDTGDGSGAGDGSGTGDGSRAGDGSGGRPVLLEVARVVRPHGLRGQVVVEVFTNRAERVAPGARLLGPTGELQVAGASPQGDANVRGAWRGRRRWLMSFHGIDTLDQAESLRGAVLAAAPLVDPEALWVDELIGCEVVDLAGSPIGVVEAVEFNPASDLLVLSGGALIPLHFVAHHRPGRLTVDLPPGLLEL